MIFLNLMLILIFLFIYFSLRKFSILSRKNKVLKRKKTITLNKNNLNNWMNLTKKERYNLLKQESITYLDKRKILLDEIRKEYKKISRGDFKENIKEK